MADASKAKPFDKNGARYLSVPAGESGKSWRWRIEYRDAPVGGSRLVDSCDVRPDETFGAVEDAIAAAKKYAAARAKTNKAVVQDAPTEDAPTEDGS